MKFSHIKKVKFVHAKIFFLDTILPAIDIGTDLWFIQKCYWLMEQPLYFIAFCYAGNLWIFFYFCWKIWFTNIVYIVLRNIEVDLYFRIFLFTQNIYIQRNCSLQFSLWSTPVYFWRFPFYWMLKGGGSGKSILLPSSISPTCSGKDGSAAKILIIRHSETSIGHWRWA